MIVGATRTYLILNNRKIETQTSANDFVVRFMFALFACNFVRPTDFPQMTFIIHFYCQTFAQKSAIHMSLSESVCDT